MIPSPADDSQFNILVVDDKPNNLRILSKMLSDRGYKVRAVISGKMALTAIQAMPPDLILLDVKMPDMDGYEVCQRLKSNEQTRHIPIIFLSALQDVTDKVKAFQVGGIDYITKPFQFEEVFVRVSTHLALQSAQAQLRLLNAELEERVKDRTKALEMAQKQLLYDALHDGLTGLPNRTLFMERVERSLRRAEEQENCLFAVLLLDLDRFKIINDSDGHQVGDQLLVLISKELKICLDPTDTVARIGGDEFAILLDPIADLSEATRITEQIRKQISLPFQLGEREVFTSVSIGIALYIKGYDRPEELLRDADIAMSRAKASGKGRYEIFDRKMHAQALKLLKLETDLRWAIQRQEFQVYYQPILALDDQSLTGFEALIRWNHPVRGLISPGEFIPCAEETELILPIGDWVLEEACRQLKTWQNQFNLANTLKMSVNISGQQLKETNIINKIDGILEKTGLSSIHLKVEITESTLIKNAAVATNLLLQLREREIELSLDDFGTGYSSLSYLHRFPVDTLKVDRSFINRIGEPGENLEIIRAIVTLAHNLGIQVTAEGIETAEQLNYLKSLKCDSGQGYFFAKPLPHTEAEKFIQLKIEN